MRWLKKSFVEICVVTDFNVEFILDQVLMFLVWQRKPAENERNQKKWGAFSRSDYIDSASSINQASNPSAVEESAVTPPTAKNYAGEALQVVNSCRHHYTGNTISELRIN